MREDIKIRERSMFKCWWERMRWGGRGKLNIKREVGEILGRTESLRKQKGMGFCVLRWKMGNLFHRQ